MKASKVLPHGSDNPYPQHTIEHDFFTKYHKRPTSLELIQYKSYWLSKKKVEKWYDKEYGENKSNNEGMA
jgi:hypothetical protein